MTLLTTAKDITSNWAQHKWNSKYSWKTVCLDMASSGIGSTFLSDYTNQKVDKKSLNTYFHCLRESAISAVHFLFNIK